MLCDRNPFTLDETVSSLDFFIDEYFFRHDVWFSNTNDCELDGLQKIIIRQKSANLYQYVRLLHPYVYDKQFDLNATDFSYGPTWAYPFLDEPESLTVAVMQLYAFWITFLGNDFLGTPFCDPKAQALNNLVIDAYLRFRADFGWQGTFSLQIDDAETDGRKAMPSLFTYGELSHLTGLATSTVRGRITNNTASDVDIQARSRVGEVFYRDIYKPDGNKVIEPYGMQIPAALSAFFEGKIGGGIKTLFTHREILPFLATNGDYLPTQFTAPTHEPFPPYDDSAKIHAAITGWLSRYTKTARVEQLLQFIHAAGMDSKGNYSFWEAMEGGKARLSLGTLASINAYMVAVEDRPTRDNPWQPLLNAYEEQARK